MAWCGLGRWTVEDASIAGAHAVMLASIQRVIGGLLSTCCRHLFVCSPCMLLCTVILYHGFKKCIDTSGWLLQPRFVGGGFSWQRCSHTFLGNSVLATARLCTAVAHAGRLLVWLLSSACQLSASMLHHLMVGLSKPRWRALSCLWLCLVPARLTPAVISSPSWLGAVEHSPEAPGLGHGWRVQG